MEDYKLHTNLNPNSLEEILNRYGQVEWEVISIIYSPTTLFTVVFRRKLEHEI